MDAIVVVNGCNNLFLDRSEFGGILKACREVLSQISNVTVQHVKREDNTVAHNLTKSISNSTLYFKEHIFYNKEQLK